MAEPRHPATVVSGAAGASVDVQQRARRQAALAGLAFASAGAAPVDAQHTQSRHLAFLPPETLDLDLSNPAHRDFGDYELQGKLGQGGMGVVYSARQKSLEREVALKLLAAGPWASADFIARFRREAQSAARMQHPNIVPIYEIGAHEELNFFSMMLVRGPTLGQVLAEQGPFEPRAAAQMVRTIAEALDYAHRLGVLHLDLKPGNVLIDERGVPMVADFGLARRIDEALASDNDEVSGTPSYMAPEQAQIKSHKLSPATDIYGIGAILYELLTGRPPFLAATPQETLKRVVTQEPARPRSLRRQVSPDLEAVALKCLAKDPKQRYASARALADDLGRYLDGRAVSVRPLNAVQRLFRWARREPRVALALGAFVFALASGLVATAVQWRRADANAGQARARSWELRAQAAQAAVVRGDGFAALRPLLQNLREMEAAGRAADAQVQRQRIGTLLANAPRLIDHRELEGRPLVTAIAVAPDGQRYAAALLTPSDERSIAEYELDSGRERWRQSTEDLTFALPFAGSSPHGSLRYTADGTRLLAMLPDQSPFPAPRIADGVVLDTRDGRPLTPPGQERQLDIVYSGDTRTALMRYRSDPSFRFPDSGQFYRVEPWQAIGPRQAIGKRVGADFWLPTEDGRWFLGSSDFEHFTLFEPGSLRRLWTVSMPGGEQAFAWRFSADASRLALAGRSGRVHLVDTRDGSLRSLHAGPVAIVRWLEFSADGGTLAAGAEDGTLMAWDVASGEPAIAPIRESGSHPRVQLVDRQLWVSAGSELRSWLLRPPGRTAASALPAVARLRVQRSFWPDGFDLHPDSRLLVAASSGGHVGLWRLPPSPVLAARAAPLPPRRIAFDGARIVAVDRATVQLREPFGNLARSPALRHPDAVRLAELSADGRRLVTVAGRTVRVFDADTGELQGEPLVLAQSPLRAELARIAPVLLLTTGEYAGDTFRERLHVIDLDRATRRQIEAFLPFKVEDFQLEPHGRYLLAVAHVSGNEAPRLLRIELGAGPGPCTELRPEALNAFGDVAIADDGSSAWLHVYGLERSARLERWDLDACRMLQRIELQVGRIEPRLVAVGDGVVAHQLEGPGLIRFDAAGVRHDAPGSSRGEAPGAFALSSDGRRAAIATPDAVELIDLERSERLSAPLAAAIAEDDTIDKLAFAPDAASLVARTARGRWLGWRLPVTGLDQDALATLTALVDPVGAEPPPGPAAVASLRAALAQDLPDVAPAAPGPDPGEKALDAAAGSEPDPRYVPLDLGPAINAPLNGNWPERLSMGGDQPLMAFGAMRLLDVDWRVDGGVQLSWGGPARSLHPTQRASALVPVADVVASRVHVLMLVHVFIQPGLAPFPAAHVVLVGADGRETVLTPMMVRDVVPHWTPNRAAPSARIAWLGLGSVSMRGGLSPPQADSHSFAVSLEVPPEVGPIRGLRLETREGPMEAPLFYAVTLERAGGPAIPP